MAAEPRLYVASDLEDMPDDGQRREIIAGELIVTPAPVFDHQYVQKRLMFLVGYPLEQQGGFSMFAAPIDLTVTPYDVVQPDLIIVRMQDVPWFRRRGKTDCPPVVAIEILSPGTARVDRRAKFALYARFGVPEYWIVDPRTRAVELYALVNGVYELLAANSEGIHRSPALGGFAFRSGALFEDAE